MEPQKPEPRIWAIVTITVAIIGCLGLLGQSFITILPDLLKTSESTNSAPQQPDTNNTLPPNIQSTDTATTVQGLQATLLGQDGFDLAVSGCHDGTGSKGIVDNHITLSGVENTGAIERIDVQYGDLDHWQYPCQSPIWELVVNESAEGVLELYFEPEGSKSKVVTFMVSLTYQDGSVIQTTVTGNSGVGR